MPRHTLNPCYAGGSGLVVMETCLSKPKKRLLLHDRTPSVVRHHQDVSGHHQIDTSWRSKTNLGQKESGSTFVLPAITSICTYNVGGLESVHAYIHTDSDCENWLAIHLQASSPQPNTCDLGPVTHPMLPRNACLTHVS
jgi:hypothetical protein